MNNCSEFLTKHAERMDELNKHLHSLQQSISESKKLENQNSIEIEKLNVEIDALLDEF